MGGKMNMYRLSMENPDVKRRLGRPRRRWVNNIIMELVDIGLGE
jgi:hypothetical protein